MQPKIDIKQLNQIEQELYAWLGKSCFFFLSPNSIDTDFPGPFANSLEKMNREIKDKLGKIRKSSKNQKDEEKQMKLDYFIRQLLQFSKEIPLPSLLEYEKENIDREVLNLLYAEHILQQLRWAEALPELALYSMEFFLPPLTEEERLGQNDRDFDLLATINVNMPFALMADEKGFFDLKLTKEREVVYHLIKSRMSLIPTLEQRAGYLFLKFGDFRKRPMLGINYKRELQEMSRILLQVVYDTQMAFIYEQLTERVPLREAYKNGRGFIASFVEQKTLEELIVFRNRQEEPLDLFVLNMLNELRQLHPEIKAETLKDFYGHIFDSIAKFILEGKLYPGHFFGIDIREATKMETNGIGNQYTITLSPVLNTGQIFNDVKEYYQIKLADETVKALLVYATQGLDMKGYFI